MCTENLETYILRCMGIPIIPRKTQDVVYCIERMEGFWLSILFCFVCFGIRSGFLLVTQAGVSLVEWFFMATQYKPVDGLVPNIITKIDRISWSYSFI